MNQSFLVFFCCCVVEEVSVHPFLFFNYTQHYYSVEECFHYFLSFLAVLSYALSHYISFSYVIIATSSSSSYVVLHGDPNTLLLLLLLRCYDDTHTHTHLCTALKNTDKCTNPCSQRKTCRWGTRQCSRECSKWLDQTLVLGREHGKAKTKKAQHGQLVNDDWW